jgi:hypothetical protein
MRDVAIEFEREELVIFALAINATLCPKTDSDQENVEHVTAMHSLLDRLIKPLS